MKKFINVLCVLILALTLADLALNLFFDGERTTSAKIDVDNFSVGMLIALLVASLGALGAGAMSFIYFIKFILNVNRNQVFTLKNISLIRKYGVCVLVIGVAMVFITSTVITGKSVVNATSGCINLFGEGLFALLMGEVFNIGLKLQEGKDAEA